MKVKHGSWVLMDFLSTFRFSFVPIPLIFHEKIIIVKKFSMREKWENYYTDLHSASWRHKMSLIFSWSSVREPLKFIPSCNPSSIISVAVSSCRFLLCEGERGRLGMGLLSSGERSCLFFFFWAFLSFFLSFSSLRGEGIKFSKPGGMDGPEIEEEEEWGLRGDFVCFGLIMGL